MTGYPPSRHDRRSPGPATRVARAGHALHLFRATATLPLMAFTELVPVVAAVIRRGERLLVARRPAHKRHGGLWEFPGGKLDPGEDLAAAAERELREELGLSVQRTGAVLFDARDPGSPFLIRFVEVEVSGTPVIREHDEVGWFTPAELRRLPLAPSDARFVLEGLRDGPA